MTPQQWAALAFFALFAATTVGIILRELNRAPFSVSQNALWILALLLARLRWRAELPPALPLNEGEGAVLICNHRSSIDPVFLQVLAGRRVIHWMVAREFCDHHLFRWLLRTCEVIPVNRGGVDTAAIKSAIRLVRDGGIVGVFPEGRINMTEELMLPARPGAVLIALKACANIIPCLLQGTPYDQTPWSPLFMSARVRLRIGPAVDLSAFHDQHRDSMLVRELMLRCLTAVADLAGDDEYQPKIAGRKWLPDDELEAARRMSESGRIEG